jgi:hypothetical protein
VADSNERLGTRCWLLVSVPRPQVPQIRVGHEPQEIAQFGDIQLAILIAVGLLELSLEKAQQLTLTYRAFVGITGGLSNVVGHEHTLDSWEYCPSGPIKML